VTTDQILACAWPSGSCDTTKPPEEHRVQVGDGPLSIKLLCEFHGQYWPKVGEDPEEAAKRTERARSRMRGGGNSLTAKNAERARQRRERAAIGSQAAADKRREEEVVDLPIHIAPDDNDEEIV
jgi:hypothetical protein